MNEENSIFAYVLTSDEGDYIPHLKFTRLISSIEVHSNKHDFASMILKDLICIRVIEYQNETYLGVYIPFVRKSFMDLTTVNWYIKTQAEKAGFKVQQMYLPDGSFIDA